MRTKEVSTLKELLSHIPPRVELIFVADVGASNTRVAFVPLQLTNTTIYFFKAQANSIPKMIKFFEETGTAAGKEVCQRIVAAGVAIPGPITERGTKTIISNFEAQDSAGRTLHVSQLPTKVCPLGKTRLLNDLQACAAGISALNHIGAFSDAFVKMWDPANNAAAPVTSSGEAKLGKGNVVVLAPGTGLGTALLYYDERKERFTVIPLEFGHVNVSTYKYGSLMGSWVSKLERGNHPPEYDDICSGRGLEFIYAAAHERGATSNTENAKLPFRKKVTAPEISTLAQGGDMDAVNAFAIKYGMLMNLASQLTMGFVPTTIVIAGDNAVRHSFFLGNHVHVKQLRDEFCSHTTERMGFMSRVQMVRQTTEMNLNLIGAAFESAILVAAARKSRL
jgi:glucokinase